MFGFVFENRSEVVLATNVPFSRDQGEHRLTFVINFRCNSTQAFTALLPCLAFSVPSFCAFERDPKPRGQSSPSLCVCVAHPVCTGTAPFKLKVLSCFLSAGKMLRGFPRLTSRLDVHTLTQVCNFKSSHVFTVCLCAVLSDVQGKKLDVNTLQINEETHHKIARQFRTIKRLN